MTTGVPTELGFNWKNALMRFMNYRRLGRVNLLFLFTVVIPTLVAILYFGLFASDIYISESKFVVRSPDKKSTSAIGVILNSAGFSNAGDEVFAAQAYVTSRDALKALNRNNAFAKSYSSHEISVYDRFNPTGLFGSFEDLYDYFQGKVGIEYDTASAISKLVVRAYTPEDALRFNRELLVMTEAMVNQLNVRGRRDLIQFAMIEVADAKEKARTAGLALSSYRNRVGVVDPEKQATVQLQMVSKLQDELIATETQLSQLRALTPENPQIDALQRRASTLQAEISKQSNLVAGASGSLSARVAQYQRLALESEFADKQLAAALSSLEDARNEARRKQAYVERVVEPNLPDDAVEPRRLRGILATFLLGLVAWGVLSMLIAGVREHVE